MNNNYLNKSLTHINTAEHLALTYKLVKDKKLLLKVLEEIQNSIISSLNSLNKSILFARVIKPENRKKIIKILKKSYFSYEEINQVIKILDINDKHKKSAIEFTRKEKIVIMMDNLKILTLDINEIKEYIKLAKKLYIKAGLQL